MDKLIAAFPKNIDTALSIASASTYKTPKNEIRNVVICGMGGSGIGGKIVAQWIEQEISLPIVFAQDYGLPQFVNEHTLIIGSSYSGNTEETLSSVELGLKRGAHVICICSGGLIQELCNSKNIDVVIVPGGNPPRTALAFSIVQLLNIFTQLKFISDNSLKNIQSAKELIEKDIKNIHEEAKKLAHFLTTSTVAIYSASNYEGIAIRARQQFNENGKVLCWHHVIPEMNHNELVGWSGGDQRYGALFLDSEDWNPRNTKRLEFSLDCIKEKTDNIFILKSKGNNLIERSIYFIHIIDWASFYLSEMLNVDPIEIKVINKLKSTLSEFKN